MQASAAAAREGVEHQLQCNSFGGNPEPNITWFRNDQPISSWAPAASSQSAMGHAGLRIEQSRFNGTTQSTLTWLPSLEDNQATYKCQVWNRAMGNAEPHSVDRTISVECKY